MGQIFVVGAIISSVLVVLTLIAEQFIKALENDGSEDD